MENNPLKGKIVQISNRETVKCSIVEEYPGGPELNSTVEVPVAMFRKHPKYFKVVSNLLETHDGAKVEEHEEIHTVHITQSPTGEISNFKIVKMKAGDAHAQRLRMFASSDNALHEYVDNYTYFTITDLRGLVADDRTVMGLVHSLRNKSIALLSEVSSNDL